MRRLFAGFPRRRGVYAVAIVRLGAFLALLPAFPAPKAFIETEIGLQAWNRGGGAALSVSEGRGFSLDWVADEEASLTVLAPRDSLIGVSTGRDAGTFTIHELTMQVD